MEKIFVLDLTGFRNLLGLALFFNFFGESSFEHSGSGVAFANICCRSIPKYIEGRYLNSPEKNLKSTMALLGVSKAKGRGNGIIK